MENGHILMPVAFEFNTPEDWDKFDKWHKGAYMPLLTSSKTCLSAERYITLGKNPQYPSPVTFNYFENLENWCAYFWSPEYSAYLKEMAAAYSGKYQIRWMAVYERIKRIAAVSPFKGDQTPPSDPNTPVILMEGMSLPAKEWDRYHAWLNEWGYEVYFPMLVKMAGLREYERYWLTNMKIRRLTPEWETVPDARYSRDLSIYRFDNLEACQNFEKSREVAAFRKALITDFPGGLTLNTNVKYRLIGRWGK
jgi:hypothetical protein